ncbi:cation:proton antiporter domain-containing protein [Halodesulfurarchaeum sp.]|uniref:cation:proton antiporter domain-containing protein n=1 Tax=Halodesulfurarchaeum sp. TaxID=1980530 RepID=UPI001BC343FE|nr:cation:proton antiporter [Halodesulfurarchaeum sp.]
MASTLLPVVAVILITGLLVQLLAHRFRIPSVVFFLLIGLILGPEGVGLVTLNTFGEGLETIVGISVAIIVFDGAFQLRADHIREASTTSLRLVTIGSVMMFLGTAAAVRLLEGVTWEIALIIGALLIATGPTVITPILEVVRVREHVAAALETEGIINDVTAAIAAVVIFDVLLLDDLGLQATVLSFLQRISIGVAAGLLATVLIFLLLRYQIAPRESQQAARFLLLSAAIGSFAVAEIFAAEAGIAAAATAGLAVGNLDLYYRETMEEFGRDVTLIALGFVFISLAALINFEAVIGLGVGGLLLVATVMFLIRPVIAWVATWGVERFDRSERLFLAAIGPRGIIPASVATLFAIELELAGNISAAQTLLGTVFIVILATDIIEAGFARQIADLLGVTPMRMLIVGGGRVGMALANRLENSGEFVVIVERDEEQKLQAENKGFTAFLGDGTNNTVLQEAGIKDAKAVIAATGKDDINLLIAQIAKTKFGIEDLYAKVNEPENDLAFESLEVKAVNAPDATAFAIENEIERHELANWIYNPEDAHAVQEAVVTSDHIGGHSIRELADEIPDSCLIIEIGEDANAHVPTADEVIETGDKVTFLGDSTAVQRAVKLFHPHT